MGLLCLIFLLYGCNYNKKITATDIKLPVCYGTNMVFQQEKPLKFYGKATPNSTVGVRVGNFLKYARVGSNGEWGVEFPVLNYKKGFDVYIEGADTIITLRNACLGDVYILAGDGFLNNKELFYPRLVKCDTAHWQNIRVFISNKTSGNWQTSQMADSVYLHHKMALELAHQLNARGNNNIGIIDLSLTPKYKKQLRDSIFTCDSALLQKISDYNYNDFYWGTVGLPFKNLNDTSQTTTWYRKKIFLNAQRRNKSYKLSLGQLNGFYAVYLNGKLLKQYEGFTSNANISIPDTLTNRWDNVLAIRSVLPDSLSFIEGPVFMETIGGQKEAINLSQSWKKGRPGNTKVALSDVQLSHLETQDILFYVKSVFYTGGATTMESGARYGNIAKKCLPDTMFVQKIYLCLNGCENQMYKDYVASVKQFNIQKARWLAKQQATPLFYSIPKNKISNTLEYRVISEAVLSEEPISAGQLIYNAVGVDTISGNLRLKYPFTGNLVSNSDTLNGFEYILADNTAAKVNATIKNNMVILPLVLNNNVTGIRYNWQLCPTEYLKTKSGDVLLSHKIIFGQ